MQKKLIALAIAGIAAVPAFAQSNVTIYGRVDYGYMTRSGDSGAVTGVNSKHEFASGIQAGSRIGFRGNEDLGNGLKAIFETEFGTGVDQPASGTTATWANRHSYVGLTGNFGTVVGGRLDGVRYGIFNKYDAFAGGTVGNFTQMTNQVDRADNAVAYISPKFGGGFTVTAAYATMIAGAEAAGNVNDLRLNTLMGQYENGPISVSLDWEQVKSVEPTAANDTKITVNTIGGSYDFGVVKVRALWDKLKQDTAGARVTDYRDYFLSATVPFAGKFNGKVTWGKVDDKTAADADANKWGIGLDYKMSKRTTIYADYGKISNKSGGAFRISPAANALGGPLGANAAAGSVANIGVKGFDLGIAHTF